MQKKILPSNQPFEAAKMEPYRDKMASFTYRMHLTPEPELLVLLITPHNREFPCLHNNDAIESSQTSGAEFFCC
jgi:hypothetical protein